MLIKILFGDPFGEFFYFGWYLVVEMICGYLNGKQYIYARLTSLADGAIAYRNTILIIVGEIIDLPRMAFHLNDI